MAKRCKEINALKAIILLFKLQNLLELWSSNPRENDGTVEKVQKVAGIYGDFLDELKKTNYKNEI